MLQYYESHLVFTKDNITTNTNGDAIYEAY